MTLPAPTLPVHQIIATSLFGNLQVTEDALFNFPEGIPGFEQERHFALLPAACRGSYWLQSTNRPDLAFFLVETGLIDSGHFGNSPDLLAIVTFPTSTSGPATANLRAPILLNRIARQARQYIDLDESLAVAHPLDLATVLQ